MAATPVSLKSPVRGSGPPGGRDSLIGQSRQASGSGADLRRLWACASQTKERRK